MEAGGSGCMRRAQTSHCVASALEECSGAKRECVCVRTCIPAQVKVTVALLGSVEGSMEHHERASEGTARAARAKRARTARTAAAGRA